MVYRLSRSLFLYFFNVPVQATTRGRPSFEEKRNASHKEMDMLEKLAKCIETD